VTAYDAEQAGDTHFLVMEYVEGVSLDRLVADVAPLSVADACDCVRQAALGLQHAFERGLVHRDVKPANLIRTPQGQVKVLDFGLARLGDEAGPLTGSGQLMGTPDFLAPEQADDARSADVRADVYSLGCTLYFLLTGAPPFPDGGVWQKLKAHAEQAPPPVTARRPDVPPELAGVLDRMLAKDPARRHQTPAEVAAALAPFTKATRPAAPTVAEPATDRGPPAPPGDGRGRRRLVAAALLLVPVAGAAALAVVLAVAFALTRTPRTTSPGPPGEAGDHSPTAFHPDPTDAPAPARIEEADRIDAHKGRVVALALNPDGDVLATGGNDGALRLWDLRTGKAKFTLRERGPQPLVVAFSPDGRTVAAGGHDNKVSCWDATTGEPGPTFGGWGDAVWAVAFSRDGRTLFAAGEERRLRAFDPETAKDRTLAECPGTVRALALTPDGRALAVGPLEKDPVRLIDTETGADRAELETSRGEYPALAVNRDGTLIAAGGMARHLKLWDAATGKVHTELPGPHEAPILGAAFSPDGAWLVSVDGQVGDPRASCRLKLWDVERGREADRLELAEGCFYRVVFAADGRSCYAALHDGTVRRYRLPVKPTGP